MRLSDTEMREAEAANIAKLPELCYSEHLANPGQVILLKRGVKGYFPFDSQGYDVALIPLYNAKLGVTPAQHEAMQMGSLCGFHVPGANPDKHDQDITPPLKQQPGEDRDAYLKRIGEEVAALFTASIQQKS
jgi:hypothetical protein